MRRALATALTTLAAPATALAAAPYAHDSLSATSAVDKSLIAHQRAHKARKLDARTSSDAASMPGYLAAIAACESGGNPRAIGGGGIYRGAFQFTYATWAAVGGSGDPAAAPMAEQIRRAEMLYARAGASQWPVCGG